MADLLTPQTIIDQPLPLLGNTTTTAPVAAGATPTSLDSTNGVVPTSFPHNPVPAPIIAVATISESINTQSRKILGNFSFAQVGALQVGKYVNGTSGEIKISSNGITATNVNGVTTFTLDGTTGDATFLGTLAAGTLVAGDSSVQIGGSSTGGNIVVYSSGVPFAVIGVV